MSNATAERIKAALKQRADANGDGKVDMQDVAVVVARIDAGVHTVGARRPWVLVVAASIGAAVASAMFTRLFGC